MKKSFIFVVLCLSLSGCVTMFLPESRWECERLEALGMKEDYEFNLSTTEKIGELLIHCVPPSQQMLVKNYEIQIDNNKIEVFKYSDVRLTLDTGSYLLKIGVKGFGFRLQKKIFIEENNVTVLSYKGPYWIWSAGKLE